MAIVNNKHNFIFFHLYKCGGTSIRHLLADNAEGNEEIFSGHSTPLDMKIQYNVWNKKDIFENAFKFTIVRNPFDFLLSIYHYARLDTKHFWHKEAMDMNFNDFPQFYIDQIKVLNLTIPHGGNKLVTPYEFICDNKGEIILDFIGKLENIDEDIKIILDSIGVEPMQMPKYNINKNNNRLYKDVYNPTSRKVVEKHFEKELEYFKYKF